MTLYDLTTEYAALLQMAEESDLDQQTISDTLEGVEGEFEDKADEYAKVIRNMAGDLAGIEKEIERLTEKKSVIKNNIQKIKNHLESAMRITGKKKFKTTLFSFGIQKNPASVSVDDETAVPEEFWIAQEPRLDKSGIRDYLKEHDVTWAHLSQTESLRIR